MWVCVCVHWLFDCLYVSCVFFENRIGFFDSAIGCVLSAMPLAVSDVSESQWLEICSFVGAHNLCGEGWQCNTCEPWWHNWRCRQCEMSVPPAWTAQKHFGLCGQSCPCCRQEVGAEMGICEECEDLWVLKTVSRAMRVALRSYSGQ